jgi:hypothetical protein
MKKQTCSLVAITCAALLPAMSWAQVFVNETFDYANDAALQAKWNNPNGMSLNLGAGNPLPAGAHNGTNSAHTWTGSAFSLTPTDAAPVVLTADLWYSGAINQRNTVGLRTGANPLFEMGFYNQAAANGLGIRLLGIAGGGDWIQLLTYTALGTGEANAKWIRMEATFTATTVNLDWDFGADGGVDGNYFKSGVSPTGAFTDLRFGGPSGVSSPGGGFLVDNIKLEVVPEPTTAALLGIGLLGLIGRMRSRH